MCFDYYLTEPIADMDPKMKEAIIKMKKLDKILNKKIKKEKEVKRDRMLLQKRYFCFSFILIYTTLFPSFAYGKLDIWNSQF